MECHGLIYKFTNKESGRVYVGMTSTTLQQRTNEHVSRMNSGSTTYFHNALRKSGLEGFYVDIIGAATTREELQEMERACIAAYNSTDKEFGYNICAGGEGVDSWIISGENHWTARPDADISHMLGDNNPMRREDVRLKFCGDGNWTRKPGADLSYMLGENNPSKRPEVKEKMSKAKKGVPLPQIRGGNHYMAKSIEFMGKQYASIMDAVRDTGYSRETVSLRAGTGWTPEYKKQHHVSKTDPEKWAELCKAASDRKKGKPNSAVRGGNNVNAKAVKVSDVVYASMREAADACHVHPDTVRNWIKAGKASYLLENKE